MLNVKKILVPTDFSENSELAFKRAVEIAEVFNSEVILLHAIPVENAMVSTYLGENGYEELKKKLTEESNQMFSKLINKFAQDKKIKVSSLIKFGEPYNEILKTEVEENIDLVVMASHTKSFFEDVFFGSTTEKVVRRSKKSVLVVRDL